MAAAGGSDDESPSSSGSASNGSGSSAGSAATAAGAEAASGSGPDAERGAPSRTPVADSMRRKLAAELQPLRLEIVDNSDQHAGHMGAWCAQGRGAGGAPGCVHSVQGRGATAPGRWTRRDTMQGCGSSCQAGAPRASPHQVPPPSRPEPRPRSPPHAGHRGSAAGGSGETHFAVEVVSQRFEGLTSIKRHRLVYQILDEEMRSPVHALQLITKTPAEAGLA